MYVLNTGRMIQVCWLVLLVEASLASHHPQVCQPNLLYDVVYRWQIPQTLFYAVNCMP